jgi:hypothetical protein
MVRELTVRTLVKNRFVFLLMTVTVLAFCAGLEIQAALAQISSSTETPSVAAPAKPTSTAATTSGPITPSSSKQYPPTEKQTSISSSPDKNQTATTLPTTHVVAGGGRPINPYSDSPETKYIQIPVTSVGCKSAKAPGRPYFVEFRSRTAQSFGHTFVLFGKLGEGNKFASYKIAGLHPKGDSAAYTMGLWIPVPAETGPSDGDIDEQFMTARYCVTLTEAEYNKVVVYIKHLQAEHKTWHGTTYNCNSFGMDVAKFIGLDTPNPNASLPKDLITKLAEMNKNRQRGSIAELSGEAALQR